MKKMLALCVALTLLLTLPTAGLAGTTVYTASNLFGIADVAQAYMDALVAWETETGNTVEDFSGLPDEMWKPVVLQELAAGKYDIIYYDIGNEDSGFILDKVVPLSEVKAAYPDAAITINPLAAEVDGRVYAVPINYYWEALYCNKDLFETNGLELPTDWGKLGTAVMKFRDLGIPPISTSLADYPHYIVEAAILASGSPTDYSSTPHSSAETPTSWAEGVKLVRELYAAGALGQNAVQTTDMESAQAFRDKEAAMHFDGSWFVGTIPPESYDSTVVVPFPSFSPSSDPTALIGGMSMGFYITRAAWDDPARRDAAVSLLQALTTDEMRAALGESLANDALRESIKAMLGNATRLCPPIADRMTPEARELWMSSIGAVAGGQKDSAELMKEVVDSGAFAQ